LYSLDWSRSSAYTVKFVIYNVFLNPHEEVTYDGIFFVWGAVRLDKRPDCADKCHASYVNDTLDPF
jgi:hypothetical protein